MSKTLPKSAAPLRATNAYEAAATVHLQYPTLDKAQDPIQCLYLRRPRLGDMRGIDLGSGTSLPMDAIITLAHRLSGQPVDVIEGIDIADLERLGDALSSFFPSAEPSQD